MTDDSDLSDLAARLERVFQQVNIQNARLSQTISTLLHRSVEYGRAQKALGENPDHTACREYIENVVNYYQEYNSLVTHLERGDTETWLEAIKKIQMWANGYFMGRNIYGRLRKKCVEECVPNAVMAYLSSSYYYDTDFDAWFCVLVQNVCRKYIKEQHHPNNTVQTQALSYDKFEFLLEALADKNEINSRKLSELRSILLEAVEQLSSNARRELIIQLYFSDYSFKEIAARMDKTLNAAYKVHFDALNELRDILDEWD
jgi:DNA-directed RNA polymerase specialized sigma24 family protein